MTYNEEKNFVFKKFLERTFFKAYETTDEKIIEKNPIFYGNYKSLELMVNDTCSANCKYCVTGDTEILMSDFTLKEIKDIKIGDKIIGLSKHERSKIEISDVVDIMNKVDDVYKISTDTNYVNITDNHPILTTHKRWKTINPNKNSDIKSGLLKKTHILRNVYNQSKVETIEYNDEFKMGYLKGMIDGDGTTVDKSYISKKTGYKYNVRFIKIFQALHNYNAIKKIEEYLKYFKITYSCKERDGGYRIYICTKAEIYKILNHEENDKNYKAGWLSGIFDAEGSIDKYTITIGQDYDINKPTYDKIINNLEFFNFEHSPVKNKNKITGIRLRGGSSELIRFLDMFRPALKQKFKSIYNRRLLGSKNIKDIKYIGKDTVYNIQTGTENYIANGFIVHNCYLKQHGNDYYPVPGLRSNKKILENTKLLFDWLAENKYYPKLELFSGDPLFQPIGFEILELLLEYLEDGRLKMDFISIPTNGGWLNDDKLVEKVEDLIKRYKSANCSIGLSFSIDGKYMEENRPFVYKNYKYDDVFYDKLFKFSAKYGYGFHPMIYSNKIENWSKNFLWFQEMFEKYNIPWNNIYLLEVRNEEWTSQQMKDLYKFIKFLITWTWEKVGKNVKSFQNFVRNGKGFNILASTFSTTGRGIGCSIQSTIAVRMGDLSIFPCHRLQYTQFKTGTFKVGSDTNHPKLTGIDADNTELYYAINSLNTKNSPRCEQCIFKNLCSGGCLGSQYESTGDIFSPIPNVCRIEMIKIMSMLITYKDLNILPDIIKDIDIKKIQDIELIELSGVFEMYEKILKGDKE